MKLTLDAATVGFEVNLEQFIKIAQSVKINSIEFSIDSIIEYLYKNSLNQLKNLFKKHNVNLEQFTCGIGIPSTIYISNELFQKKIKKWIYNCKLAAEFGCKRASVSVERKYGDLINKRDLTINELTYRINTLCDIANDYGIEISIEFVDPDLFIIQDEILAQLSQKNIGLLIDINVLYRISKPLILLDKLPEKSISWVHLSDINSVKNKWLLPHKGIIPFNEVFDILLSKGYNGNISLEIYDDELSNFPPEQRALKAVNSIYNSYLSKYF